MKSSSLTVVGTGIKFLSHITTEARVYIEKADKVLYLVNDPLLQQWINKTNKNSEALDKIYFKHSSRIDSYSEITKYILSFMLKPINLCVALYGHPSVFSKPALDAVKIAKMNGCSAKILPGISAEACLFADLLIDPGTHGCQSFEATDFLLYNRKFDINSHLILWQPDVIGTLNHTDKLENSGLILLQEYLAKCYPLQHEIIIYEAAQYPGLNAKIIKTKLEKLHSCMLSPISTLYVPPVINGQLVLNIEYATKLKLLNI